MRHRRLAFANGVTPMKLVAGAVFLLGTVALAAAGFLSQRAAMTAESVDEREPRAALAALEEYFSAIEGRACARLMAVSARISSEAQCQAELAEFARHRARFVKVVRLVRDGRNEKAWLATTEVSTDGRPREILLRVEHGGDRFRVVA